VGRMLRLGTARWTWPGSVDRQALGRVGLERDDGGFLALSGDPAYLAPGPRVLIGPARFDLRGGAFVGVEP
jgi:hypothetical protein